MAIILGVMMATGVKDRSWAAAVPRALSVFFAVLAAYSAVIALVGPLRSLLRPASTLISASLFSVEPNLGYAVFLALLAGAVSRRKRAAYWLLVVLLSLTVLLDVVLLPLVYLFRDRAIEGMHPTWLLVTGAINLVFIGALLTMLVLARHEFYAKMQRGAFRKALLTLVALLALSFGVAYLLVMIFPGTLVPQDRFAWALEKALGGAVTLDLDRVGHPPSWVGFAVGLLTAVAILSAFLVLFRSQRASAELPADEEARVRALLAVAGERDSLGYFATRRDRTAIFSPSGKAAVSYRPVAGVSLAGGDPVGDVEAWEPAIRTWMEQAREYGWTPAAIGASEEGARAYNRAGLRVLQLGDEAVIRVAGFTLDGREMRGVRQAVHRIRRTGHTLRVRRHEELTPEEMRQIIDRAEAWRDTETERGFSMALGRLGDPADGRCVLVEALGPDGGPAALLSFVPWGEHGLSLDLMRRDREADNGLTEFMVAGLVERAPGLGVEHVSLNFAVFRSAFEEGARIGAGPVLRAWRRTLLFFSRWWQLESLYRSNVKYRPEWVPRYLAYEDGRDLPKVGLASAIAEGFLGHGPSLPTLLRRGESPARAEAEAPVAPQRQDERAGKEPCGPPEEEGRRGPAVPEQVRVRLAKLDRIRAEGGDPYPVGCPRTHTAAEVRRAHPATAPDRRTGERVTVAGRVVLVRDHGRLLFATITDWSGTLQLMITQAADLGRWRRTVDLGDHVGCTGEVVTSKTGELSVLADEWTLAAKCLHPLPGKRRGQVGPEARVRQPHLDLITDPEARRTLRIKGAVLHGLRAGLVRRGFLEVETPILQSVHGGANARPFTTHMNAYDMELCLRIAPELHLKRLCVGGVERVFELGRTFRNEGVSYKHNPEFTMLEAYQAYADYRTMLDLARDLVQEAAVAAFGAPVARREGQEVDISGTWRTVGVHEAVSQAAGEEVTMDTSVQELRKLADRLAVPYDPRWGRGEVILELYERLVEERTVEPTFYTDFPSEVCPLTRPHRRDPRLAERWDLVAFGVEIGTAYSELIDPVEQRRRLTEQSSRAAGGDPEAMALDEDFLNVLEYAMPPTGGLGLGVDRLVMMLTGKSIRQVLSFPLVRPRG
ncbi:bifunctional lysylphosphatidylglycerol synthetase/lysine--tRNA ligase LysX [Streptosporangium sp. NPDC000396]|uniref:bifunctional lysylphosphatidylglycerol synthetase/lysine--tRNA ligase LysX n=1 Tax=Streptosporangium sp. NPDC000396 TaxID=3366185 RepID=UPI0036CA74C6